MSSVVLVEKVYALAEEKEGEKSIGEREKFINRREKRWGRRKDMKREREEKGFIL